MGDLISYMHLKHVGIIEIGSFAGTNCSGDKPPSWELTNLAACDSPSLDWNLQADAGDGSYSAGGY